MIPVGGTYTVDGNSAAAVSKALSAPIVIPMHFKTKKCNLPIAGVDAFLEKMGNVKKLNVSEIEITTDGIHKDSQEVWVLNHAC